MSKYAFFPSSELDILAGYRLLGWELLYVIILKALVVSASCSY